MDDTISRQAVIDAVSDRYYKYGRFAKLEELVWAIEKVPSAQSEQEWVPCSERLPDLWDERYLVSLAWGGVGTMEYKSTGFHNYGSFSPVPIETVTAWMPLPEPYQEEGGE